jgi:pyruvate kinase
MGDVLELRDTRARLRRWQVASVVSGNVEILSDRTSYIQTGTVIHGPASKGAVGPLPRIELPLVLHVGDRLALTRSPSQGRAARRSDGESAEAPAQIPCEPPELVDMVCPGQAIWLDDGKIGGVIDSVDADAILVRITTAAPAGAKLRAGKGINLPDSDLTLSAFAAHDREALAFAAEAADIVSLSFIRDPKDVHELQDRLTALGRADLGIILKIETRGGFERLPELLLAAMRSPTPGVMIARGDLAVECGFPRLAEVQEEILWLCEAAHVPVVWATQVLETLAKTGSPTRAEVTDAAMAERAECVMLNKGPFIVGAVALLDDILRRMAGHQDKKSAMFRPLRVAQLFQERLEHLGVEQRP